MCYYSPAPEAIALAPGRPSITTPPPFKAYTLWRGPVNSLSLNGWPYSHCHFEVLSRGALFPPRDHVSSRHGAVKEWPGPAPPPENASRMGGASNHAHANTIFNAQSCSLDVFPSLSYTATTALFSVIIISPTELMARYRDDFTPVITLTGMPS